jgi:hypothetical protein
MSYDGELFLEGMFWERTDVFLCRLVDLDCNVRFLLVSDRPRLSGRNTAMASLPSTSIREAPVHLSQIPFGCKSGEGVLLGDGEESFLLLPITTIRKSLVKVQQGYPMSVVAATVLFGWLVRGVFDGGLDDVCVLYPGVRSVHLQVGRTSNSAVESHASWPSPADVSSQSGTEQGRLSQPFDGMGEAGSKYLAKVRQPVTAGDVRAINGKGAIAVPGSPVQPARPFVVVTAASGNHLCQLQQELKSLALNEPNTRVVVYDIGWEPRLTAVWLKQFNANIVGPRWFNYTAYPKHFHDRLRYAWKPAIIKETVDEFGSVLWMDAGNVVQTPTALNKIQVTLRLDGFVSATSPGSVTKWTHSGMFSYFGLDKEEIEKADHRQGVSFGRGMNCNGAVIGFESESDAYSQILEPWAKCAFDKDCIAPKGSSRSNHRQDQSALTLLVNFVTNSSFKCSPGLLKGDLKIQQDKMAVGSCTKPPADMVGPNENLHGRGVELPVT